MKDRLLGMSLSYRKVGDSSLSPLVREEIFFQGDSAMTNHVSLDAMPFHIISTSGFDAQRTVTENASPGNVQNRELTVYLRVRDRSVDIHDTLGKYMDAVDTTESSLHNLQELYNVPRGLTGSGIITLNLYMGDGTTYGLKRYECSVSIKSITGDLYVPSNNLYVLTMVMHDHAFVRYGAPFRVEWDIPYEGSFVDANHDPLGTIRHKTTRLPDGITRNRLTRPRITVEATAVSTTKSNAQYVELMGYFTSTTYPNNTTRFNHKNLLDVTVVGRQIVNPQDPYLEPGETTSLIINDPFNPGDIYIGPPRYVVESNPALHFFNGGYETSHTQRGFDHMDFPIADGATVQISTGTYTTPAPIAGADIKVKFDFFDMLTGVLL